MENSTLSPVFLKVKKTREMFKNGKCTGKKTETSQHSFPQEKQKESLSDNLGNCLSLTYSKEDPGRMKHRRKQKTPKKFTGEQPAISGTFGLKGINKVDEKLKVSRTKRPEGAPFHEEPKKKQLIPDLAKRELPCHSQAPDSGTQDAILEHIDASVSSCSAVTYKACPGFKKHLKVCQKETFNEESRLDSRKDEVKEMFSTDKAKPDPAYMKIKRSLEERKRNKSTVIMEPKKEWLELMRTPSGRVRRLSAQVAVFHLQEIAEDELANSWETKRRFKDDLVPDIKRLNYTRPGLPTLNSETLDTWKNEVKEKGFICCPNGSCEAVYSSVSGLKAHLTSCIKGDFLVGKYTCLLCQKKFSSESGVKYHICKTHSQNWFRATDHVSHSKTKESQNNKLQKDMKNGVPWKKRGRKPKEHLVKKVFTQEKTFYSSYGPSVNYQTMNANTSQTLIETLSQNPDCTKPNNFPTTELQPPIKKRAKTKKTPHIE